MADRAALLLLDAGGRRLLPARSARALLAGALLCELVLAGRLEADPDADALRVLPAPPAGGQQPPRLEAVAARLAQRPLPARRAVRAVAGGPVWEEAVAALGKAGAVREVRGRRSLLWSSVRWPAEEAAHLPVQREVREALVAASRRRRALVVDPGTACLVLLLSAAGCLGAVVPGLPADLEPEEAIDEAAEALAQALERAGALPEAAVEALEGVQVAVAALARVGSGGDGPVPDGASHDSSHDSGGGSGGDSGGGGGGGD
ncbi:GPP34 family phosphoprotein [Kineococcus vitellinus]|uniref:GPP34 family phosphoprotein n=1 Tax=Kineococcus vitellinus TaxID=2696565 RepID=UPI0030B802C8